MRATPQGPSRMRALLALPFLLLPSVAAGDAIVRSNAMRATTTVEFFVDETRILVELEIGAADGHPRGTERHTAVAGRRRPCPTTGETLHDLVDVDAAASP